MKQEEAEWSALATVMASTDPLRAMSELQTVVNGEMFANQFTRAIFKKWVQADKPEQISLMVAFDNSTIEPSMAGAVSEMLTSSMPLAPVPVKALGKIIQDNGIKQRIYRDVSNGKVTSFEDLASLTEELEQYQNFQTDNTDLIDEYREYIGREREYIDLMQELYIQAERGQMIVIAGRPGMGKTALATNMMSYLVTRLQSVAFISLEMRRTEVFKRMVDNLTNDPTIDADTALELYQAEIMYFDIKDNVRADITSIELEIARQAEAGRKVIVVDYLQLITAKGISRYEQVSDISRRLKLAAMKYNIVLIALAQLNRSKAGEKDKRPQMTDLRDSGSIEQDADKVILLHSDQYYEENTPEIIDLDLIVSKNRQGGPHTFHSEYNRAKQSIVILPS